MEYVSLLKTRETVAKLNAVSKVGAVNLLSDEHGVHFHTHSDYYHKDEATATPTWVAATLGDAKAYSEGNYTVDAVMLKKWLGLQKMGTRCDIFVDGRTLWIEASGTGRKMAISNEDDQVFHPSFPLATDPWFSTTGNSLAAIKMAGDNTPKDSVRPALDMVELHTNNQRLMSAATDGFTLTLHTHDDVDVRKNSYALVNPLAVGFLVEMGNTADDVIAKSSEGLFTFWGDDMVVSIKSPALTYQCTPIVYPDYAPVIPKRPCAAQVAFRRSDAVQMVKEMGIQKLTGVVIRDRADAAVLLGLSGGQRNCSVGYKATLESKVKGGVDKWPAVDIKHFERAVKAEQLGDLVFYEVHSAVEPTVFSSKNGNTKLIVAPFHYNELA